MNAPLASRDRWLRRGRLVASCLQRLVATGASWLWLFLGLSAWSQPGSVDPSFQSGPPFLTVNRLAVQDDGKIYIAGTFTNYLGAKANGFLRLNADGSPDASFQLGTGFAGLRIEIPGLFTNVSAPQFNGVVPTTRGVLVGGIFSSFNGTPRTNLVRLTATGALDAAFQTRVDDSVQAVTVQSDGRILIGGGFKNVNGVARNGLARLNVDGTLDTGFNPVWGSVLPGVRALVVQPDGKILAGGVHATFGAAGLSPKALVRLNANGTLDAGFKIPSTKALSEGVFSMLVQGDGKIVVAGSFVALEGVNRNKLARLLADGTVDATWSGAGAAPGGTSVSAVVPGPGTQMYVGGRFDTLNGAGPAGIARLNADGSHDASFQKPAGSSTYWAEALAVQKDGKLLASGTFTLGTTTESTRTVLRLISEGAVAVPPPVIGTQPAGQAIPLGATGRLLSVTATGSPPLAYQWFKDGAALSLKTEASLAFSTFRESDAGSYHVVVTNPGGSVTSVVAVVSALIPARITTQPSDLSVAHGQSATFNVEVSGTSPISYQWRRDAVDIPGATAATFTIPSSQAGDAGRYSVAVGNAAWGETSREATLFVLVPAPVITVQPQGQVVTLAETNLTARALAGRRLRLTVAGALPPWIDRGTYEIVFTETSYSSPAGGALANASSGTYAVGPGSAPVATLIDFGTFFPGGEAARLTLVPNGIYEFNRADLVADQNGRWELVPAFVPPLGPTVVLSVTATGLEPITFQWRRNGLALPGRTGSTLVLENVQRSDLGEYTVIVTNGGGSVLSHVAVLSEAVTAPPARLSDPTLQNGQLAFGVATTAGRTYDIQFLPGIGSGNWSTIQTLTGNGSVMPVLVPTSGSAGVVRVGQRP